MKRCPQCQFDELVDSAAFCTRCGADLDRPAETHTQSFEDSGVETAELRDDSSLAESPSGSGFDEPSVKRLRPILPSDVSALDDEELTEPLQAKMYGSIPAAEDMTPPPAQKQEAEPEPDDPQQIKKLSKQEIEAISMSMYAGTSNRPYLSDDEKRNLLRSIDKTETSTEAKAKSAVPVAKTNRPPVNEATDAHRPKMADRLRGVSYYFGNVVYLTGNQRLHENDEAAINDRIYVLRKYSLSPKAKWISLGAAAAVLLIACIAIFTSGAGSGSGTVIGIVLDDTQQPFIQGAAIRFPDLGKEIESNGQGFFVADGISSGSHKIEYVVNNQVVGTDYATVVAGEVTTVALRPAEEASGSFAHETPEEISSLPTSAATDVAQPRFAEPQQTSSPSPKATSAQLVLAANVEGATLRVDGQVVGIGNLAYQKLKPGKRSYTVSAEGYQTVSGTVNLGANKTTTLEVALQPLPAERQASPEELAYSAAETAMNGGDFATAIAQYSEVISLKPTSSKAYLMRAEARAKAGDREGTVADLTAGGNLALNEGNGNQAYQAFDRASQLDRKSTQALLGRATANLARGQDIAAIADYEAVVSLDRRNVKAFMGIGEARYNLGNFKEAIDNFKDAQKLDPNNAEIYEYLMLSYLGDNDIKNVRKTFEKYRKMVSEDQLAQMNTQEKYRLLMQVVTTGN